MSHRPAASGPDSKPIYNGSQPPQSSRQTPVLPPIVDSRSYGSPILGEHGRAAAEVTSCPASLSRASSSAMTTPSDPEQVLSRPIRMQNILNPSGATENHSRPPTAIKAESPIAARASPRHPPESPESMGYGITPGRALPAMNPFPPVSMQGNPQIPSPHLVATRAASLGSISLQSGTIDAKRSPFLSGSGPAYSTDTGPSLSLGPTVGSTPPIAPRPTYGFPLQHAVTPPDRRLVEAIPPPQSQSNSPTTSYSSYSHRSHASPALQYSTPASQASIANYYGPTGSGPSGPPGGPQLTLGTESAYGPVTSAVGQSTYQLMTLDTDQGPIQRNAGASARFRQRRKEKEREASQTIAKLENHIRDIGEEREYYRMERDYFRGLVYSSPTQNLVTPRLPSPRLRRMAQPVGNGATPGVQWQQSEERGGQEGRNTRRRISAYSTTYELPPQPPMPQSNQQPSYGSTQGPYVPPDTQAQTPGGRPPLPPAPTQLGPYDPSAPPGYERNWKPE